MANPDDIHAALNEVAGSIDAGDMETARTDVRNTLNRRRRRTRIAASLGATVLLVGGVVAFASFDNSDEAATLVVVDAPTAVAADDSVPLETSATTPPEALNVPGPTSSSSQARTVSSPAFEGFDRGYGAEWVAPWKNGFLVGTTINAPQPLPATLPDDVVALFPDEVVELFADGLPPTVAEAITMLAEAGLTDVVTEILAQNPNASTAVFSAPLQNSSIDARFTVDGTTWEPIELILPDGLQGGHSVVGVGDRLAVLAQSSLDSSNGEESFVVASTTDLTTWTVQPIALPPLPVELPGLVTRNVRARNLIANESGWIVSIYASSQLFVDSLLPNDVLSPENGGAYRGYNTTDTGVEVFVGVGPDAEAARKLTYTWEELGVAPAVVEFLELYSGGDQQIWAAQWAGESARSDLEPNFGDLVATDSGFLVWSDQTWFSADGLSWSASALPTPDAQVTGSMSYGSGVLLVASEGDSSAISRVDARGLSPELVKVPGLPTPWIWVGQQNLSGSALILDSAQSTVTADPVVVEADGFEFTWDLDSGLYELRDATTGGILVSGFVGPDDQFVNFRSDRTDFLDPATGELLVSFTREMLGDALAQQTQSQSASATYEPDRWLLATNDGEQFIVDDLDDGNDFGPVMAAVNGDTMLVLSGGSWNRYTFS